MNDTTYYYVISAVNALGESADSDEASATPFIQPDVVVSSLVAPVTVGAGSTVAVTVTTKNLANRERRSVDDAAVSVGRRGAERVGSAARPEQAVPALAAGASSTATLSVDIPASISAGTHVLIAKADAGNVLNESNEANNTMTRTLVVGPDLTIFTLTAPATGAAGATVTVTDTVKNQGAGQAAAATRTRFYFSTNSVLDAADVLPARHSRRAGSGRWLDEHRHDNAHNSVLGHRRHVLHHRKGRWRRRDRRDERNQQHVRTLDSDRRRPRWCPR